MVLWLRVVGGLFVVATVAFLVSDVVMSLEEPLLFESIWGRLAPGADSPLSVPK